jgi:hypothetical protein
VLKRLIQRASVADGKNIGCSFASRLGQLALLTAMKSKTAVDALVVTRAKPPDSFTNP